MSMHLIHQHPNLVLTEEVYYLISQNRLCRKAKKNLFKGFLSLDVNGLNVDKLGGKLVKTSEGWELVAKGDSEWRFKIRELMNCDSSIYEITSYYKK